MKNHVPGIAMSFGVGKAVASLILQSDSGFVQLNKKMKNEFIGKYFKIIKNQIL